MLMLRHYLPSSFSPPQAAVLPAQPSLPTPPSHTTHPHAPPPPQTAPLQAQPPNSTGSGTYTLAPQPVDTSNLSYLTGMLTAQLQNLSAVSQQTQQEWIQQQSRERAMHNAPPIHTATPVPPVQQPPFATSSYPSVPFHQPPVTTVYQATQPFHAHQGHLAATATSHPPPRYQSPGALPMIAMAQQPLAPQHPSPPRLEQSTRVVQAEHRGPLHVRVNVLGRCYLLADKGVLCMRVCDICFQRLTVETPGIQDWSVRQLMDQVMIRANGHTDNPVSIRFVRLLTN